MLPYNCECLLNSKHEKALKYTHVLLRNVGDLINKNFGNTNMELLQKCHFISIEDQI
jgi:HD-like signal output (HDOD) protein